MKSFINNKRHEILKQVVRLHKILGKEVLVVGKRRKFDAHKA